MTIAKETLRDQKKKKIILTIILPSIIVVSYPGLTVYFFFCNVGRGLFHPLLGPTVKKEESRNQNLVGEAK